MVMEPVMHALGDKLTQRWGSRFVKSSKNWNYLWPLVLCPELAGTFIAQSNS